MLVRRALSLVLLLILIGTPVGATLPATASGGSATPQVARAERPADLMRICVSSRRARVDASCANGEQARALRVGRPTELCRAQDGALSGLRCGPGQRKIMLPRNSRAMMCATGTARVLSLVARKGECDGTMFRAVNRVPGTPRLDDATVAENAGRQRVGSLSAHDADPGDQLSFRLHSTGTDTDNSLFSIVGRSLILTKSVSAAAHPRLTVGIQVVDLMGKRRADTLSIVVTSQPATAPATPPAPPSTTPPATPSAPPSAPPATPSAPPSDPTAPVAPALPTTFTLSPTSVAENTVARIGALSIADADPTTAPTYVVAAGETDVEIRNGNELWTRRGLDHETTPTFPVRINVTDTGGVALTNDFVLTVTDVNEAPTAVRLGDLIVPERQPVGTEVTTLGADDPDAGAAHSFSLVAGAGDTDNSAFRISGTSLESAVVFDFDTRSTYSVRIRATDKGGLFTEGSFTITVDAVNDPPTGLMLSSTSTAENSPVGTGVGNFMAVDPDGVAPYTYALVSGTGSNDNDQFVVDGSTLRSAAVFDFEARSSFTIRVRVTDSGGAGFERSFTINVTDVNEAPTVPTLSTSLIEENRPTGTTVGTLSATDPDAGQTVSYALASGSGDTDNATFAVVGNQLRTVASFNYEAKSSYTVRLRVSDSASPALSSEATFTITVTDVNDPPTVASDTFEKAIGNTAAKFGSVATTGPTVVLTGSVPLANDSDEDGDSLSVVTGTYTGSQGGTLTLLDDTSFTYRPQVGDAGLTDSFTYPVSDGQATSMSTLTVTIENRRIWWVDAAAVGGNGTSSMPYSSLTPLNSGTDPDGVGDEIFLHSGTYTAGITLEQNQKLTGAKAGLTGLVAAGAAPQIQVNAALPALTLADNNVVRGVSLLSTGTAPTVLADGVSQVTVADDVAISASSGTAVQIANAAAPNMTLGAQITAGTGGAVRLLANGTGSVAFAGSVIQSGSGSLPALDVTGNSTSIAFTGKVDLDSGTATALRYTGGGSLSLVSPLNTLTTTTGTTISVGSGTGSLNVTGVGVNARSGTPTLAGGQPLVVAGHSGGTVKVSAPLTGAGLALNNNTGATVNLLGRLTLANATSQLVGFNATGGGTVSASASGNTVLTTTGSAVNIVGTTIGDKVLFETVASNGAFSGINLDSTGAGTFEVTGSGASLCGGRVTAGGAGGSASVGIRPDAAECASTIRNSTGVGVRLVNTRSPGLNSVRIVDSASHGVQIVGVGGTAILSNSQVTGNGTAGGHRGIDVTGSDTLVRDSWVDDSYDANVAATGTGAVTLATSYVSNAGRRGGQSGDGVQARARGTANLSVVVQDSIFEDNIGDHIDLSASDAAALTRADVVANRMATSPNAVAAGALGGGVLISTGGTNWGQQARFHLTNNAIQNARTSAVTISQSGTASTARLIGEVTQNTIGGTGIDSCSAAGSAIAVRNRDGAGALTARISNNTLAQCWGSAIDALATDGPVVTDLSVVANTVAAFNGGTPQRVFDARFGRGNSDMSNNTCLDLRDTISPGNSAGIFVAVHPSIATKLAGYTTGSVPGYLSSTNSAIPANAAGAFTAAPNCQTP